MLFLEDFLKIFGIPLNSAEVRRKLSESNLEEMDKYWEESKNIVD